MVGQGRLTVNSIEGANEELSRLPFNCLQIVWQCFLPSCLLDCCL